MAAKETLYSVGAAQVDITPDYPIRLSGYGARKQESEGIDQHIFAQALAIGADQKSLAVLITVDSVAVNELLQQPLTPLRQKLACRVKPISLPFDTLPARQEWVARAQSTNHWIAYHAKKNLARLDRGEKLPTELPYLVQTWTFDDNLAMVFLAGEVVVDYSLRLKKEYDATRLWVNAYANDVPCYIPSKRVWREGGYEGGGAMIYYDRPTRLAEGTEASIASTVHELMPREFLAGQ